MSLLQLELFLTRIFSVTMWYHFAFMAISLAMFGLAAGAVAVELGKKRNVHVSLERAALGFALTSVVCFIVELRIPVDPEKSIGLTAIAFVLIAIPFVFAGVVVCVALTRFPSHTGALYAADLAGSAAGCLLTIPILNSIHAPSAVILNAAIALLAVAALGAESPGALRDSRGGRSGDAGAYKRCHKNGRYLLDERRCHGPGRLRKMECIVSNRRWRLQRRPVRMGNESGL